MTSQFFAIASALVLSLASQPTAGGDVERCFSHCGTGFKRQHKLSQQCSEMSGHQG